MKASLFLLLALPFSAFCQSWLRPMTLSERLKPVELSERRDTSFNVIRVQQESQKVGPAFFINGKRMSEGVFLSIDPASIAHVEVYKDAKGTHDMAYDGQVHITLKPEYSPAFISLNELRAKYAPEITGFTVFMVDGKIIKDDADLYYVDESYLLTVFIDNISNVAEGMKLPLIGVLTKTEKNIKERNNIRFRGTASLADDAPYLKVAAD